MIQSVHIENFKSVVDLTLELGTFNVLIGENGCGKSNILEAIAFGAAASADKLDREFMGSRGIRFTNPEFMVSAFKGITKEPSIIVSFKINEKEYVFDLINESNTSKKWIKKVVKSLAEQLSPLHLPAKTDEDFSNLIKLIESASNKIQPVLPIAPTPPTFKTPPTFNENSNVGKLIRLLQEIDMSLLFDISNYFVCAPEESKLRKFEDTEQIYPLGVKGEGLFQYLKELALDKKHEDTFNEIKERLTILDWFEDLALPQNIMHNEFALNIKDKYLDENLQYFDQKSTNEGFLFLLFYLTLFISDQTPKFFAIDNIEASFNPKLCTELIKNLVVLAKKHGKQVIVTTHNPAVLDGLDLEDDSQRLFVVRRNREGYTQAERIEHKAERTMPLSEIWTSGFIGGLPNNF